MHIIIHSHNGCVRYLPLRPPFTRDPLYFTSILARINSIHLELFLLKYQLSMVILSYQGKYLRFD